MQKGILDRSGDNRRFGRCWRPQGAVRLFRESGLHAPACVQALSMRLAAAKSGAVAAEYALLVAFISILAAAGMVLLGDDLSVYFKNLGEALGNASTPTPDDFAT